MFSSLVIFLLLSFKIIIILLRNRRFSIIPQVEKCPSAPSYNKSSLLQRFSVCVSGRRSHIRISDRQQENHMLGKRKVESGEIRMFVESAQNPDCETAKIALAISLPTAYNA